MGWENFNCFSLGILWRDFNSFWFNLGLNGEGGGSGPGGIAGTGGIEIGLDACGI